MSDQKTMTYIIRLSRDADAEQIIDKWMSSPIAAKLLSAQYSWEREEWILMFQKTQEDQP